MQKQVTTLGNTEKPLWRRIVDYPLVAMLIATLIYIVAVSLGLGLRTVHLPVGPAWKAIVHAIAEIGIVLAAYKLVIVRLGERPRDDLPHMVRFETSALDCLPA